MFFTKLRISVLKFQFLFKLLLIIFLLFICTRIVYQAVLIRNTRTFNLQSNLTSNSFEEVKANPKLCCVISTYGGRMDDVAIHSQQTWAKHCDRMHFISDKGHTVLDPIIIQRTQGNWKFMRQLLAYVEHFHRDDGDWFVLANDDNYVIVENLRYLLSSYSSEEPIHFGCKLKNKNGEPYMSNAAPIVLSREALRRFVDIALHNPDLCNVGNDGAPDEELAKCLKNVNVQFGDSRDIHGSHTILPFEAETHLHGLNKTLHAWYYEKAFYPVKNDYVPVSKNAISFHINYTPLMYTYEYMIYKVRRFGRMPKNLDDNEVKMFSRYSQHTTVPSPRMKLIPTQPQPETLSPDLHPEVIPPKPLYVE